MNLQLSTVSDLASLADIVNSFTPSETVAVCRHLSAALPTPDVPLTDTLRLAGHTLEGAYRELATAADPFAMVAAARMKGLKPRILPPDPRLSPTPHRPLRNAPPRAERQAAAIASAEGIPGDHRITAKGDNPHAAGSSRALRFDSVQPGMTVAEARRAGAKASDIQRWRAEGSITISGGEVL